MARFLAGLVLSRSRSVSGSLFLFFSISSSGPSTIGLAANLAARLAAAVSTGAGAGVGVGMGAVAPPSKLTVLPFFSNFLRISATRLGAGPLEEAGALEEDAALLPLGDVVDSSGGGG